MTREEMIALLSESSGGHRSREDVEALLDTSIVKAEALQRPDFEDDICLCGEAIDNCPDAYDHVTHGY